MHIENGSELCEKYLSIC